MDPQNTTNQQPFAPIPTEAETTSPVGSMPPTQSPPQATPQTIVTPPSGSGFLKKLILILVGILVLVLGAFAVVRFVLPGLSGVVSGTELVWWGLWEDEGIIEPIIAQYEQANPSVKITYVKNAKEDYRERLASSLAREDGPDIFRLHSSWVPMFGEELDAAPANIISSQEFGDTFYPVAADDLIGPEGPVAIPLMYDGLAMFVNEDIFTTYGATIPRDWNELREVARSLTIKDERGVITQSGASLGTANNVDHWPEIVALLMLQNGADPASPNDAAGRGGQALSFYKQFAAVDNVWDDTLPGSTIAFATGRVAMYFAPSWRVFEIKDRNPSLKFRVESVPQVPKEDPTAPDITYASYWAEGVWSKSKHAGEAWKFLKFLSQREQLTKLYQNSSQSRLFGEPYPRPDMRELLLGDPIVGGFLELAPTAKSNYLYSRTFDGASGINSSLTQYYEDALGAIDPKRDSSRQVSTLSSGVQQVLSRYGLAPPIPTEK